MSFGDFIDGATELPRNLIGGAAVALGADQQSTQDFLGLNPDGVKDNPDGIIDAIKSNPAKFVGELVPYMFLPMRIYGKTLHTRAANAVKSRGGSSRSQKAASIIVDHVNMAATMGTFGGIEEIAKAQVEGRDSHVANRMATDAALTIGMSALFHTAITGSSHIKNKALRKKWVKDIFTDAGFTSKDMPDIDSLSTADRHVLLQKLGDSVQNSSNTLRGVLIGAQPHIKFGENEKTPLFNELFSAHHKQKNIDEILMKDSNPAVNDFSKLGDDKDANLSHVARAFHGLASTIREMIPNIERRNLITKSLDVNGERYIRELTSGERAVAKQIREAFDGYAEIMLKHKIIKSKRVSYIPHILNSMDDSTPIEDMLNSIGKRSHVSKNTARGKERIDTRSLHEKDYKTLDIADLVDLYGQQTGRAAATKTLLKGIDIKSISREVKYNGKHPDNIMDSNSHPALISEYVSKEYREYFNDVRESAYDEMLSITNDMDKSAKFAKEARSKAVQDKIESVQLEIHPDARPSIDMLFKTTDMNEAIKAASLINATSKRSLIFMALFHFNALSESALFSGAGGIGMALKGAATGFVVSGFNPLGAVVGMSLGSGVGALVRSKHIPDALRHGAYGDRYSYAQRFIDIKPPRDVENDAFFEGLQSVQGVIDKYVPSNTAKGILKNGTKAIGGINKVIDVLMWDRLMTGSKLIVFESNAARLHAENLLKPKHLQRPEDELSALAGQFTDDAFGGQNWRKLAEMVESKFGKRWAAAMATQEGKVWTNLVMFAPDWTISNIRILAKAFPLINKDAESRGMYQRYAIRAAIYYTILGTAVQQYLTGTNIWDNRDPTRLDLGNGQTMSFSKQLSEPFKWVENPLHEAVIKQSSLLKGIEEQVSNSQYIGAYGHAPKITEGDDTAIEKIGDRVVVAGSHFAPIFAQDIGRNGVQGVYGFFGHPIYGSIRALPQNVDGNVYKES